MIGLVIVTHGGLASEFLSAMTSAWVSSITEMARFEGVPPNMSVSRITPSPS